MRTPFPLSTDSAARTGRRHRGRALVLVGAALALAAGLTGCAAPGTGGMPAPVSVDLGSVNGSTVRVQVGNVVNLTGDDTDFTSWSAHIRDERIVTFSPGKDDGSAQFNPGLRAVAEGSTEVTLDNSASGKTVTFTVDVTPKG